MNAVILIQYLHIYTVSKYIQYLHIYFLGNGEQVESISHHELIVHGV